jgi:hypothetical protein
MHGIWNAVISYHKVFQQYLRFVQAFGCKDTEEENIRNGHCWRHYKDSASFGEILISFEGLGINRYRRAVLQSSLRAEQREDGGRPLVIASDWRLPEV